MQIQIQFFSPDIVWAVSLSPCLHPQSQDKWYHLYQYLKTHWYSWKEGTLGDYAHEIMPWSRLIFFKFSSSSLAKIVFKCPTQVPDLIMISFVKGKIIHQYFLVLWLSSFCSSHLLEKVNTIILKDKTCLFFWKS